MTTDQRIMRIALPVHLIRQMDEVILAGIGGYSTRAEFIVDAISERVLELTISDVEDAGAPAQAPWSGQTTVREAGVASPTLGPVAISLARTTELTSTSAGFVIASDQRIDQREGVPLFGMHNRDYPSLWALDYLAGQSMERPVAAESFYRGVTAAAWKFGEWLASLPKVQTNQLTALFPTNPEKKKSSEAGFRSFAIGDYRRHPNGAYKTTGPLFEWQVIGIMAGHDQQPMLGLTEPGWALLTHMSGISIEQPHPARVSERFLDHLRQFAPMDWKGFMAVMAAIGSEGATRQQVLEHMAEAWPDWSQNEVSTNAAGYVARAREWGLVEPKQVNSKYHLTRFGSERSNGAQS